MAPGAGRTPAGSPGGELDEEDQNHRNYYQKNRAGPGGGVRGSTAKAGAPERKL